MDYNGADDGVFTHVGKCVKHYNLQKTDGSDLATDRDEILEAFQAGGRNGCISPLFGEVTSWQGQHVGRRGALVNYATRRLQQRESVLAEVNATSSEMSEVLPKLMAKMREDAESIQRSTVTLGIPGDVDGYTNIGDPTILLTKQLDGVTSPGKDRSAMVDYAGRDSELSVPSESMRLTCSADSYNGGQDGGETWSWTGGQSDVQHGIKSEGSGAIGTVPGLNASSLLQNRDFESFSSNTPASWSIVTGTAGTHIKDQSSTVFHGSHALELVGDGSIAAIELTQAPQRLTPLARYCVAVRVRAPLALSAGTLAVQFTGTGYSAAAGTVEVQRLQISGTPTGGTYTITWRGQTTGAIAYNASSATVQTALRALIGLESVVVSTQAGSVPNITHDLTMHGVNELLLGSAITCDISSLTGGTPARTISTPTPGVSSEKILLPAAAIPVGAWGLRFFFVTMPAVLPSNIALSISLSGTPTNSRSVYLDDLAFGRVTYGGGVGVAIVRGATRPVRGDRWEWTVANSEGVFQRFFRQAFGVQLPSSASPTIADSLAT